MEESEEGRMRLVFAIRGLRWYADSTDHDVTARRYGAPRCWKAYIYISEAYVLPLLLNTIDLHTLTQGFGGALKP
jgi:hypothetical protein